MSVPNKSSNASTTSVAIIAIAKDEAAYFPEWVHHHAYFGFEGFYIGINRTQDASHEVISALKHKYSDIHCYNVDWIDKGSTDSKNTDLQSLTYAYLSDIAINKNKYTHLVYLDIDEFWFHTDFSTDINEYLSSLRKFDVASFNWLMQYGDQKSFSRPFESLSGEPRRQLKSLMCVDLYEHISSFRCHLPKVGPSRDRYIHIDANDKIFVEGEHEQISNETPTSDTNVFVLHRAYRSQEEYVALLGRKNPDDHCPIKSNRRGFKKGKGNCLKFNPVILEKYWESFDQTVHECQLNPILNAARQNILSQSKTILEGDVSTIANYAKEYDQALKGTQYYAELYTKLKRSSGDVLETALDAKLVDFIRNLEVYVKVFEGKGVDDALLNKIPKKHDMLKRPSSGTVFMKCASFYERLKQPKLCFHYVGLALLSRPNDQLLQSKYDDLSNTFMASK